MTRAALAMAMCAPLSCAFCGSDTAVGPKGPSPSQSNDAPTSIMSAPAGVVLDRGPCAEGWFLSSAKRCVPLSWHCAPAFYEGGAADGCDCNCGAPDPDCADPQATKWCYKLGRTQQVASCQSCD